MAVCCDWSWRQQKETTGGTDKLRWRETIFVWTKETKVEELEVAWVINCPFWEATHTVMTKPGRCFTSLVAQELVVKTAQNCAIFFSDRNLWKFRILAKTFNTHHQRQLAISHLQLHAAHSKTQCAPQNCHIAKTEGNLQSSCQSVIWPWKRATLKLSRKMLQGRASALCANWLKRNFPVQRRCNRQNRAWLKTRRGRKRWPCKSRCMVTSRVGLLQEWRLFLSQTLTYCKTQSTSFKKQLPNWRLQKIRRTSLPLPHHASAWSKTAKKPSRFDASLESAHCSLFLFQSRDADRC